MTATSIKRQSNSPLLTAIAISVGVHAVALYLFYTHPMLLHYSLSSLFGTSTPSPQYLENEEEQFAKSRVIEEVFEHILVLSPHLQQPFDLASLPKGMAIAPEKEPLSSPHFSYEHSEPDLLLQENIALSLEAFALDSDSTPSIEVSSRTPEIESLFSPQLEVASTINSYDIDHIALSGINAAYLIDAIAVNVPASDVTQEAGANPAMLASHLFVEPLADSAPSDVDQKLLELDTLLSVNKLGESVVFYSHPPFAKMHAPRIAIELSEDELDAYLPSTMETAVEWNDDFDLDITFLPHPQGKGYIFSLALKPNFDISQYSLKHDVLFLIDRSVRKGRFEVYKRAVVKALSSLQPGDTFNVYLFDKKLTRFHAKSLPVSQKTIRAAEHFLEKQSQDVFASAGDIYMSLDKILPEVQEGDGSVHTAILITDGVSQISSRKQQQVLRNWMDKNEGKLSLYTAAVGQKNDLLLLDMLSTISGGKLLWSDTHAAFPRKLAKLVLDLKDPVATDLIIDAIPIHGDARIQVAHNVLQSPALFSHQPFIIYGTIDKPGPFELIVQGRHRDQWIAIKKTVSFIDGAKGDHTLLNQWSAQKAQLSYLKFLNDGKTSNLKEAREILKKSRSEIAFE